MIVLYVPFARAEAGDLVAGMDEWLRNHLPNSAESIRVVYFGEPLKLALLYEPLQVYICAHGYANSSLEVGNHKNYTQALRISAEKVAQRFNYDFLLVHHRICSIHVYCCGESRKNSAIASQLTEDLQLFECRIVSYSGILTVPDMNGTQWSLDGNSRVPVGFTARELKSKSLAANSDSDRVLITKSSSLWWRDSQESRKMSFFMHQKLDRKRKFEDVYHSEQSALSASL
ncbi:RNA binding protein (contains ribosomal protein S1 domain) [Legionella quinlivanii]|uniref:RNA binding protein (Contains ribosomal protein S1 domain) n=1 Tax=Legionella quinlivanii TaxID=45073 RepID=A0A0W0Y5K0_9GAMM|nr:hypothetical protein [Legionella quinlivanii]KTD51926.1 RNA binding protein (contains ribosomal protein S1 domain) [Legionella quinlivanii]SEF85028.1 hypothetical protein SAMN02746093_01231 [Legionella quinlivanii DSM 21216]STY09611.1 RNA binding protein (contains ribosomal protein S1 domain) [Legionella quinlivanii]